MTVGIYFIRNICNNKLYVGQSRNVESRLNRHRNDLDGLRHYNSHLQASWNMYGSYMFIFQTIMECEEKDLDKWEGFFIDFFDSCNPEYGYNRSRFEQGKKVYTEQYRENLSTAALKYYETNKPWNYGIKRWRDIILYRRVCRFLDKYNMTVPNENKQEQTQGERNV